jgi:hypothetical protein
MGTSSDSNFILTVEHIPAWFKCLFVIQNAESSVKELLAFLQTFPTGPIRRTAGMMIDEKRHQPLIQPL